MREDRAQEELTDALTRQRDAQRQEPLPTWEVRADRLRRLRALVKESRASIAAAIHRDFSHRPQAETDLLEIFPSIGGIDHALRHGKKWMKPRRRQTGLWFKPARSVLLPQPLGVIGIIVPWNYPLFLAVGPLTCALAAGNRAMVKLSELTPEFAALFAELIRAHFDPAEATVLNGDADVARAFSSLPFDHLLFTGSTRIGRDVMRAASANLTPVTLELGGKSPAVIGTNADFDAAVTSILRGKLFNAGQTCIAPDYVLLPKGKEARFIETARRVFDKLYPPSRQFQDYASIITERHRNRLLSLIDDAAQAGATVHPLAASSEPPSGRCLPPVLITGVADNMAVMQEEIFGPILPVLSYASLDEAVHYINTRPRPLALYMFDRDRGSIDRMITQTVAGGVTVNDTLLHIAQDDLPFGGAGDSGMGAYHGKDGFDTFSKLKPVVYQSRLNGMWLIQPPYGKRFKQMMRLMLP
ncbi:coniferyl aldehyde dehydrogenase [Noviherbaspirillum saxi]|uniref:Aldehyde dehydrogenase n=1 Tax=Noviherbaspirillum saxi TaxID=2320863 RepID=A0A3A3FH99_9BURK|nr:coniferyl aldehyde dehydrogenase [Noviherbaspirillum saxi]RJF92761.1 coniferyl aldehyde dehydrogenase [Noviherbaspirillum saxi]